VQDGWPYRVGHFGSGQGVDVRGWAEKAGGWGRVGTAGDYRGWPGPVGDYRGRQGVGYLGLFAEA